MNNNLPITKYLPAISECLSQNNNLVLQAEPGAGKSTAVPLSLMNSTLLNGKKIILLEPRRLAVKSIASYLSKLLGESVGQQVGYQIRNERKISKNTILEIVTEGVLTRRLQNDPELLDVGLIIFDEFHERSIHADLALMLALEVQAAYREDLKLLVMSATIDTKQISKYLNNAPIIQCPGRTFPVSFEYLSNPKLNLTQQVLKSLYVAFQKITSGDILVFLPGQSDIKRCIQAANEQYGSDITFLPLYGSLPLSQQELVLTRKDSNQRRVIFTTNIAETSLTIDGITMVIDSGLEKVLTFDAKSGLSRLDTVYISKASATQRAGRAGRLKEGHCLRLWNESAHATLSDFQVEEVVTSNLSNLALELSAWGITKFSEANWLTEPPIFNFEIACDLNSTLGLIDHNNKILPLGSKALKLGVDPRLASMLLSCESILEKKIGCILAALLSERDILVNAESSDVLERVMLFVDYLSDRNSLKYNKMVNVNALEQAIKLAKSFAKNIGVSSLIEGLNLSIFHSHIGSLLLKAFPDRLAKVRSKNGQRYLLANGRGVTLRNSDSMQDSTWLVVCDCDGKNKDGFVYLSAAISMTDIKSKLTPEFTEAFDYSLDSKKEKVIGRRKLLYKALVIEDEVLSFIHQDKFERCVEDILKQEGLIFLNWNARCESWLVRATWLASVTDDFPHISKHSLIKELDKWLLPYISHIKSIKQLKQFNIFDLLTANLTWEENQFLERHAPVSYITPSGKPINIRYDENQGPTISVVLQEMFGELSSPHIALNKVPLRFELLSPAKRPVQTTSDLSHFWKTSYFDVIKDMRSKYPKHRWPEEPLLEKPGRSMKKRIN